MICRFVLFFTLLSSPVLAADPWITIKPGGETLCSTGTPYEFHMREGDPGKLMIFFNGGGACWSGDNCDVTTEPTTYRPFADGDGNTPRTRDGAFALTNSENPFSSWTQVFVPYCTGDIHLGTKDHTYTKKDGSQITVHHRGRINAQAALEHVFDAVPTPDTIFVSGGSAGAISSPYFAAIFAQHYADAEIIHFAGGGGGYTQNPLPELWKPWGVFTDLPAWFDAQTYTADTTRQIDFYTMAAAAAPRIKFHQYNNAFDAVQEQFSGMLNTGDNLYAPLKENMATLRADLPYFRSYTAPGEFHTLLRFKELYTTTSNGVRAVDWVRNIADGKEVSDVTCGDADACQ